MFRSLTLVPVLVCFAGAIPSVHAQRWSPDGEWLAYVVSFPSATSHSDASQLAWLLDSAGVARSKPLTGAAEPEETLWATHLASGESVALDRGEYELTEPSWSPDGTSMVHGRLIRAEGDALPRFELVLQTNEMGPRILGGWPWKRSVGQLDEESRQAVAWSGDANWLVAPWPEGAGLMVVEARTGRITRIIEGAKSPSWSPEGSALAFVQPGAVSRLMLLRNGDDPTLVELGVMSDSSNVGLPAPVWSQDGERVFVLAPVGNSGESPSMRLAVYRVDPAGLEPPVHLAESATPASRRLLSADFCPIPGSGDVLFVTERIDQPNLISWMRGSRGEVYKRFHPFLEGVPIRSLRLCPRPGVLKLAIRLGESPRGYPPAIVDPDTEKLALIVPDESARRAWRDLIRSGIGSVIEGLRQPVPGVREASLEGPTRLLLPGSVGAEDPGMKRLRRLARMGQGVGNDARSDPGIEASSATAPEPFAESSPVDLLIYGVLLGRFEEAEAALERVFTLPMDAESRERLLGLRAQLALGEGRKDRAAAIIGYLEDSATHGGLLVEETGADAPRLSGPIRSAVVWVDGLRLALEGKAQGGDTAGGGDGAFLNLGAIEGLQREFEGPRGFEAGEENDVFVVPMPPTPIVRPEPAAGR